MNITDIHDDRNILLSRLSNNKEISLINFTRILEPDGDLHFLMDAIVHGKEIELLHGLHWVGVLFKFHAFDLPADNYRIKNTPPKSWDDLKFISGFNINGSNLLSFKKNQTRAEVEGHIIVKCELTARAVLPYSKLTHVYHAYLEGVYLTHEDFDGFETYYSPFMNSNGELDNISSELPRPFSFESVDLCNRFLEHNYELLKQSAPIWCF